MQWSPEKSLPCSLSDQLQQSTLPRIQYSCVEMTVLLSSEVRLAEGLTFDLRKRRFPKPTNLSGNLKIYIEENGL